MVENLKYSTDTPHKRVFFIFDCMKRNEFDNFSLAVQNGPLVDKDGVSENLQKVHRMYRTRGRVPRRDARRQVEEIETEFHEANASQQEKIASRLKRIASLFD